MKIGTVAKTAKGNVTMDDKAICMVKHPTTEKHTGHANGRKVHLSIDGKISVCNMPIQHFFQDGDWLSKKFCKICYKQYLNH